MTHRKTLDKNNGLRTIKHKTVSSPEFTEDIDPINLLETLDGHIETLNNNPDQKAVQYVRSWLQSMEILTMDYADKNWWINEPLVLHKYLMKRSMTKRVGHLIKTKGEWKSGRVRKSDLEARFHVRLPINATIYPKDSKAKIEIKHGIVDPLLLAVVAIHRSVEGMLEAGTSSSGVFRKPTAVIQMNKLKMWLESNEIDGLWEIQDKLRIMNLEDIANTTVLTTNP